MKRTVLLLAALAAAPAFAENLYLTGSVGRAEQKLKLDGQSFDDNDTGYGVALGYGFARGVGVEVGYAVLGEGSISEDGYVLTSKPKSAYAALVGSMPVGSNLSLMAKVGAAHTRTTVTGSFGGISESSKEKETSLLLGVGAAYAVSPTVSIVAEYHHFGKIIKEDGADLKASMISLGARFGF